MLISVSIALPFFASCSESSSSHRIELRLFTVNRRFSLPSLATEIAPVSSETITINASLTSDMPKAARWRVPSVRLIS